MIKVITGTGFNRTEFIIEETTTLMDAAEKAGLNIPAGGVTLNGTMVGVADFNKTFKDFGIIDKCYLLQVVKADNA